MRYQPLVAGAKVCWPVFLQPRWSSSGARVCAALLAGRNDQPKEPEEASPGLNTIAVPALAIGSATGKSPLVWMTRICCRRVLLPGVPEPRTPSRASQPVPQPSAAAITVVVPLGLIATAGLMQAGL